MYQSVHIHPSKFLLKFFLIDGDPLVDISINCGDEMHCTDSFEWVGTAGLDATAMASTCADRYVLAGTASKRLK